ncbi:unnamed protein product, partial [Ectocarpus sp. 4 AP-2014]
MLSCSPENPFPLAKIAHSTRTSFTPNILNRKHRSHDRIRHRGSSLASAPGCGISPSRKRDPGLTHGQARVIIVLLRAGAKTDALAEKTKGTALATAAFTGNADAVKALAEAGARLGDSEFDKHAIHMATIRQDLGIVKILGRGGHDDCKRRRQHRSRGEQPAGARRHRQGIHPARSPVCSGSGHVRVGCFYGSVRGGAVRASRSRRRIHLGWCAPCTGRAAPHGTTVVRGFKREAGGMPVSRSPRPQTGRPRAIVA